MALDVAISGRPASRPGTAVEICGRMSSEEAKYGSKSSSAMVSVEETGQMKASTERRWASCRRSSLAKKCEAVVPRGSIEPEGMSCFIELVLVSTLYDMRHILVPSAFLLVRGITKARVSGRMAMERDPVGESTKV